MHCDYFDTERCRSCTLMGVPYAAQLSDLDAHLRGVLGEFVPPAAWLPVFAGPESAFRNKAKLVVGGRRGAPTLGILDAQGAGIDLRNCGLYEAPLHDAIHVFAHFVAHVGLTPYDIPTKNGELKNVIVTVSPDAELMVRFVFRSQGQLGRLRDALPDLTAMLPRVQVVSANLLPEHRAALEGATEIMLTESAALPMRLGEATLHLRPQSFFQTNTAVARALYDQAREWLAESAAEVVWDLFCGVGGFALCSAAPAGAVRVRGVETSVQAIESARLSATGIHNRYPATQFEFTSGDAAELLLAQPAPDAVIVNPPRRGIGPQIGEWLNTCGATSVLYSSCNADSLATDLRHLSNFKVTNARGFAMFPQTRHHEVLLALRRTSN